MAAEASSASVTRLGRLAIRCQPDHRLVALTREGSDAAFEEIVGRYRDRLVAYATRIAPPSRGEDVVQESLIRALSALRRGNDPIELRPWLYRIVHNRALNDLRDQPSHAELNEEVDGVPQPPDVAARRTDIATIVAELKSLPDAQREALVQRELGGRSHEEIASALAVTPGAVRGLIFRARTALRDAVGVVIPLPVLRALAGSGAAGGGAAVAAASAGGGAVKLGVGLTIAAVAVGSGIALEVHPGHHSPPVAAARDSRDPAVAVGAADPAPVVDASSAQGSGAGAAAGEGRGGSSGHGGSGPGRDGGPGPSANSGSGASGGSGASSGPESGGEASSGGGPGPSSGSGSGDGSSGTDGAGSSFGSGDGSGSSGRDGGGSGSGSSGSSTVSGTSSGSGSDSGDLSSGSGSDGMSSGSGSGELSGSSGSGGLSGSGSGELSGGSFGTDGGSSGPG